MALKKKTDHLHIIRGIAALMVVLFHARFILWCGGEQFNKVSHPVFEKIVAYAGMVFLTAGRPMVICFFVLSGFFMQLSFSNNKITQFYLNRIIRIYIPYIVNTIITCCILFVCISFINPKLKIPFNKSFEIATSPLIAYHELNFGTFIKSLFFLPQNKYIGWNAQYWSLLYEAIFYLTIPLLMIRKIPVLAIAVLTFVAGFFYSPQNIILQYVFNFLIFFQAGICLHLIIDHPYVEKIVGKINNFYIIIICFLLYSASSLLELLKHDQLTNFVGGILGIFSIVFFYHEAEFVFNLKTYKWLKKLGDISYSLYLNHFLVLYFIYAVITRVSGVYIIYQPYYILSIIVVLPFSVAFFQLVERPSLRLKKLLKK